MALSTCIKQSLRHAGVAYTILRDDGDIAGEYMGARTTEQVTKPLTMEHFRVMDVPADTSLIAGDVVEFDKTDERFLVMNLHPNVLANEIALYQGAIYKCNVLAGKVYRPSGEVWGDTYHKQTQWGLVKEDVSAMHVAALYGARLEDDEELALLGLMKDEVYLPKSIGVKVLDRWQPFSGEFYMVKVIEPRRFPGVDVAVVEEDTR